MSWIGGKKALRDEIIARFPLDYTRYIEVFGGGGWVLFHKAPERDFEVYNDFNPNLANLYRCVRDHPDELCDELRYMLNSRLDFDYVREMMHNNAWYDYMFGSKNPAISGLNNLIGEGLSMLKELDPLKLEWDWKTQGLINAYYDDGGMPHAELTDAGYNYLQDSDLNFIGDVFGFGPAEAGKLVEQGYASIVKGYNIEAVKAQQLAHGVVENGGSLIMDFKTYSNSQSGYADMLTTAASQGFVKVNYVPNPTKPSEGLVITIESNIKGISNSEALALAVANQGTSGAIKQQMAFRLTKIQNEWKAFNNIKELGQTVITGISYDWSCLVRNYAGHLQSYHHGDGDKCRSEDR